MYERRRELNEGELGDTTWSGFNPDPENWFETYLNRAKWLFRNSGYGFDYYLFGIKWFPQEWTKVKFYNTSELVIFIASSPDAFNIYYHGKYGMYKLGWKAWNMFSPNQIGPQFGGVWGPENKIPICFSINPFKKR
jgi:hypothetical protein